MNDFKLSRKRFMITTECLFDVDIWISAVILEGRSWHEEQARIACSLT